ncbi:hypothetical protein [Algisphaera agarilytica]|uniref:Uncharacterized protein n=1 Tax=Algisphaera agarilytica TaxID=1385975 RepID=A0A7X0LMK0_9BACT|nr:hypothetical protein [Algisphaera agarilytica]MBB6431103.1 hypothetical protein [Algisphaera agarilytica]
MTKANATIDNASSAKKPVPFFTTPVGTVALAVILWVVACVLAVAAVSILSTMEFANEQMQLLITYLAFGPSTIAIVLSVVFLIVGSIRWAIFGRRALPSATLNSSRELALLESINQRLLLSETAKKITYRTEDMAVLRTTLREDIKRHEYDAAMVLVTELAAAYGQLEEAENFRAEIDAARRKDQEEKIATGIAQLEKHLAAHDFDAANKEAARLQRLYPEEVSVAELPPRVAAAKEQYKKELERAFLQANEREEVDRALDIMKVLDKMLTPEEAEPFREVARGVVGKKRDNLGVQFKLAVHDKEWTAAVQAGEQIIKQFPNTRMADEVRSLIDHLRANAAGQQQAAAAPPVTPVTSETELPAGPAPIPPASAPANPASPPPPATGISFKQVEE